MINGCFKDFYAFIVLPIKRHSGLHRLEKPCSSLPTVWIRRQNWSPLGTSSLSNCIPSTDSPFLFLLLLRRTSLLFIPLIKHRAEQYAHRPLFSGRPGICFKTCFQTKPYNKYRYKFFKKENGCKFLIFVVFSTLPDKSSRFYPSRISILLHLVWYTRSPSCVPPTRLFPEWLPSAGLLPIDFWNDE